MTIGNRLSTNLNKPELLVITIAKTIIKLSSHAPPVLNMNTDNFLNIQPEISNIRIGFQNRITYLKCRWSS